MPAEQPDLPMSQVVNEIVRYHKDLYRDWGDGGWAPADAAALLKSSRLDWLVSLAETLFIWESMAQTPSPGRLILAWTNLGGLVEGSLKLFLSVYLNDYRNSVSKNQAESIYKSLWDPKTQQPNDPDGLMLEKLRVFFAKAVWDGLDKKNWDVWLRHILERRNAIHAYKTRDLGTFDEFFLDVRQYLIFLREEIAPLPEKPDEN